MNLNQVLDLNLLEKEINKSVTSELNDFSQENKLNVTFDDFNVSIDDEALEKYNYNEAAIKAEVNEEIKNVKEGFFYNESSINM